MSSDKTGGAPQSFAPNRGSSILPKSRSHQNVRWVIRRKVEVLTAVRTGNMSIEEACERHNISMEEIVSWSRAMDRARPAGLFAIRDFRGDRHECG